MSQRTRSHYLTQQFTDSSVVDTMAVRRKSVLVSRYYKVAAGVSTQGKPICQIIIYAVHPSAPVYTQDINVLLLWGDTVWHRFGTGHLECVGNRQIVPS